MLGYIPQKTPLQVNPQGEPPAKETPLPSRPPYQGDPLPRRPPCQGDPLSKETPPYQGDPLQGDPPKPTPRGEIEGNQVQAHNQGGN